MKIKILHLIRWLYNTSDKLAMLFPDWITGKSEVMRQKYKIKYGSKDCGYLIKKNKMRTMAVYLGIAALLTVLLSAGFVVQLKEKREIRGIERPAYGQAAKSVPVEAQIKYQNYRIHENFKIAVKAEKMDERQKQEVLEEYKKRLGKLILGGNTDLNHVSKPLNLIQRDAVSGITISWTSDHPDIISEKGVVDLMEAEASGEVVLQAKLLLDDAASIGIYSIRIDPAAEKKDIERSISEKLKRKVEMAASEDDNNVLLLPADLGSDSEIRWIAANQSNLSFYIFLLLLIALINYFKRYDKIDREIRASEESLVRDLPEFINKLVLLLNAGLVVSTAFAKITDDYRLLYHKGQPDKQRERRYLYEELLEIENKVHQSNTSLLIELKDFSKRCGVREMVRITAVISDNWSKGSVLAEKLERESEMLWNVRKKRAEEKGRIAETKLTFPLVILLMVLIMVTIVPAMMEM